MKEEKKNRLLLYGFVFLCSLAVTIFLLPSTFLWIPTLKPGQISPVDVRSPVSLKVIDREKLEEEKREVREKILPLFKYDASAQKETIRNIENLPFLSQEEKELLKELINSYYKRGILSELPEGYKKIKVLRRGKTQILEVKNFLTLENLKSEFKRDLLELFKNQETVSKIYQKLKLKPNYIYLKEKTQNLWGKAESKVKPVYITVKRGEIIVKKGERVSETASEKLKLVRHKALEGRSFIRYFSLFLIIIALYYSVLRLYRILSPSMFQEKYLLFSFSVITLDVFLIKFLTFVSKTVFETLNLPLNEGLLYVPVLSSVIFGSIFLNKKVALIHAIPVVLISNFIVSKPQLLIIPLLIASFFTAFDSRKFKSRDVMYVNIAKGTLALILIQEITFVFLQGFELKLEELIEPVLAVFGALTTSIVVNGLSPVIAKVFNFTTDITYMELINLNHPLLRKLVLRAPGTYNHSVMVATLSEAAAEAIGANALLAKAGGLFHDIGKIKNPQAFAENQTNGVNIHDKLPPEKSAAILRSHVEYGVELGKKYNLPEKVIDIIRQHHGTKLMKFFYHKAKELYGDKVDEKVYRYPGPKPQFKESGIVMLADTVEAATRSMKDKDYDLGEFIHKLIMETINEGQLDQSGLSLKEIATIEKVFKKILSGVYHSRVEYPEEGESNV